MQRSEDQVYEGADQPFVAKIFSVKNNRSSEFYDCLNLPETKSKRKRGDREYAVVHHVTVKDISVFCDERLLQHFGKDCVTVFLRNVIPTSEYAHLTVENLVLNGKKLSPDEIRVLHEGDTQAALTLR
jgi:hypothetical protein